MMLLIISDKHYFEHTMYIIILIKKAGVPGFLSLY